MVELVVPTVRLHAAWLEARDDWGPGVHEDGFGLQASDETDTPTGFALWVARLNGDKLCQYTWIVENDRVLGGIALRHGPDDVVRRLGHLGYGVRPAARRRGLATWALGRMLDDARTLGLARVLVVCEADNTASASTIERHGGILETAHPVRRYWITLDSLPT